MIEIKNICKTYINGHIVNDVLQDVSAVFPTGENVGILGVNGAGKSTLLRIMSGVEMPDSGEVIRKGKISWPIGFSGGLNGSLSGEENCRFIARIYDEDEDYVVGFAQEFSQIGKYFHNPVKTYSSGMKARVAFGLSMAINFNVYMVDEVTAVGDKRFQNRCREAFRARQEHSSVIMVSHSMNTIKQYCTKCAILTRGSLTFFDSVDEAAEIYEAL